MKHFEMIPTDICNKQKCIIQPVSHFALSGNEQKNKNKTKKSQSPIIIAAEK